MYDELLRRQNVTRKRLLKIRKITEQETSSGRGLPDLVIPKKARRKRDIMQYKFNSYREYRLTMAKLKAQYGNFELSIGKEYYFKNYVNALKQMIQSVLDSEHIKYEVDKAGLIYGEGWHGRFTEEQIRDFTGSNRDLKRYFDFYNKIIGMSSHLEQFLVMYFFGNIPVLKYIYLEMQGSFESQQIEMFYDSASSFYKDFRKGNVMYRSLYDYFREKHPENED